jgi:hypothetical protein
MPPRSYIVVGDKWIRNDGTGRTVEVKDIHVGGGYVGVRIKTVIGGHASTVTKATSLLDRFTLVYRKGVTAP